MSAESLGLSVLWPLVMIELQVHFTVKMSFASSIKCHFLTKHKTFFEDDSEKNNTLKKAVYI